MQSIATSTVLSAPNLFRYATKELSQDAFFCWLLAWADGACAASDAVMHQIGREFVNLLLAEHGLAIAERTRIIVHRQYNYIDILIEVGDDFILLIEDKIHAGIHGDQLTRYKDRIAEAFPGRTIAPVFLKTGDQARYDKVDQAGFRRVGRDKLLNFLRPAYKRSPHPILHDFLAVLEEMDAAVQSFQSAPPSVWKGSSPWIGLYTRLQAEFDDLDWDYVANPSGGFLAAWWHGRFWTNPGTGRTYNVYLQIEQGPVCFKIAVEEETDKVGPRDAWRSTLVEAAQRGGPAIRPISRKSGKWMTVARVERDDWMKLDADGLLDFDGTVSCLKAAMQLVDQGVQAAKAVHAGP